LSFDRKFLYSEESDFWGVLREYYLGLPQITDFVKVRIGGRNNNRLPTESLRICSLISFHRHMASARHVLYSNTDIMLLDLDRCSSVMRLRLMIRDRIFLWINERSTQIVVRHEEEGSEADYHKKKNHFRKSSIAERSTCGDCRK